MKTFKGLFGASLQVSLNKELRIETYEKIERLNAKHSTFLFAFILTISFAYRLEIVPPPFYRT